MSNHPEVRDVAQRPARFPLPVILAAAGVIATFTLGLVVQGTAPKPPLILLADSGVFAEGSEFAGDPAFTLDYVAGPELSGSTGTGSVHEMVVQGSPTDVLSQLAPLFSLELQREQGCELRENVRRGSLDHHFMHRPRAGAPGKFRACNIVERECRIPRKL